MKKLILMFLVVMFALGVSILAYAQNTEPAKPQEKVSIEESKAKILSLIDDRIKMLQEERACVSSAKTDEDMRKCRGKARFERRGPRQEMKDQGKN